MMWTDFSKKIVTGALAPALVFSLTPAMAFAAVDDDTAESNGSAAIVVEETVGGSEEAVSESEDEQVAASVEEQQDVASELPAETAEAETEVTEEDAVSAQASEGSIITFSGSAVSVPEQGSGYKVSGTELTINEAGTYVITGSCADGGITVKKGTTGVTLVLRDLTLGSSSGAPLCCNKTTGVTVQVEGTVTLADNENAADEDSTDEAIADAFEGAAVKAKSGSNLVITGTGTLNANGSSCKNGIKGAATASVTIEGGVTVNATAANTGIASDGSVTIAGGVVNVTAGNDGIKADPDDDDAESAGAMSITGGTVNVNSSDDGIKGETTEVTGGTVTVNAGDDGIKAEGDLTIGTEGAASGPSINVAQSVEGLEGATVNLYSGKGVIVSSDDGINAANGDLATESTSLFNLNIAGGDWTVNAQGDGLDSNGNITMTGGKMVVYGPTQGGNGVFDVADNGGSFTVNGGTLLGMGTSDMAIAPSSGTYVAFGASGGMGGMNGGPGGMGGMGGNMGGGPGGMGGGFRPMSEDEDASVDAQAFGGATQGSSYNIGAGQSVSVKDSSGNELVSTTAAKSASWVLFASSDVQTGQAYTLNVDGSQVASATAQQGDGSTGGQMGGQPGGNAGGQPGGDMGGQFGGQPGGNAGGLPGGQFGGQPGGEAGMGQPDQADGAQASSGTMYRLYNPNSGEHFYTGSSAEKDSLVGVGWRYEGVGWTAPESGDAVYRLYNPNAGDHHYTTSAAERDSLVDAGWRYEGIGWYSDSSTGSPLYRLYNPNARSGAHHYTTSAAERDSLVGVGWRSEGVGWYGA